MNRESSANKSRKKKKLGEIALELQEKELNEQHLPSVNELVQDILYGNADGTSEGKAKSYLERVWDEALDAFKTYDTPYCFVEVRYRSTGPLGHNTTDKLFIGRRTCPTPTYNQDAFRVSDAGEIEYLWSVPSRVDVALTLEHRHSLALDPEYSELVKMVLDYTDGTLHSLAQHFDAEYTQTVKGYA